MKPAPFKYLAPRSIEEIVSLKSEYGDDAKFLAGGQSLIPTMNFRLAKPEVLIDINRAEQLNFVRLTDDRCVRLGALARHFEVLENAIMVETQPLAHEAARYVAHPQIRNLGTVCGNLAHADPASEFPAVMVAVGGRMCARSVRGERWIDAGDFFQGVFTTALEEDEMLAEIELPAQTAQTGCSFMEVSRRHGDYAMMGVAAMLSVDDQGLCSDARLAYCGAGGTPIAATRAAASLLGQAPTEQQFKAAAEIVRGEIEPTGNINASAGFQQHLAVVLTGRSLAVALQRAQAAAA